MNRQVTNKDFLMLEGKKRNGLSMDKIMTILCYVALITVVILPCLMIIYYTFWDGSKIDFEMFKSVLFQAENLKAMKNTLIIAVFATLFATVVGVFFAWLLVRSDIPLKGIMKFLFSIPFMIPPFLAAMSWDMMFSGRGGYVNKALMSLFHLAKAPFNINSIAGIVVIEVVYYFPFVYMQVVSALERMDPTLEESARIAGAGQLHVIRTITLPLTIPAISSGVLLVLITSLSNYGIPSMVGYSKGIFTLPTMIDVATVVRVLSEAKFMRVAYDSDDQVAYELSIPAASALRAFVGSGDISASFADVDVDQIVDLLGDGELRVRFDRECRPRSVAFDLEFSVPAGDGVPMPVKANLNVALAFSGHGSVTDAEVSAPAKVSDSAQLSDDPFAVGVLIRELGTVG